MTGGFHLPTRVVLGRGAVDQVGDVVRAFGSVALVVLGVGSAHRTGAAGRVVRALQDAGIRTIVESGISSNPRVDQVDAARARSHRERCDVVVAVGGGSVIDAGKVIAVGATVASSAELLDPAATSHPGLPLVTVPTILGSGAEVTKGAILTDTERAARGAVRGEHLFPVVAVVDPRLHATVPARHAVAAAFDCLTHAVEATVAVGRTPFTDELAGRVIRLVAGHLRSISRREVTDEMLDDLALASVMGGMCVANASTCLPHRLQQAMGAVPELEISHGDGLAAVYPAWLERVRATVPHRLALVADALGTADASGAIERLLAGAGLDRTLSDHGFRPEHLPRLVAGVTGNLANDPTVDGSPRHEQIIDLYERSMTRRRAPVPPPTAAAPTATESRTPMIDPPSNVAAHMTTELVGKPGSVFLVLSGPGGTGKSSLIRMWRDSDPDLGYVKNVTTRGRRAPDPTSGVDDEEFFEFVTRPEFHRRAEAGELAQWVNPQEGYYSGTPLAPLLEAVAQGRDLVFDYTPQLFLNLQRAFPEQVVGVFVAPPSLEVLRSRLAGRGSEEGAKLQLKFNMGAQDMAYVDMHDYHVTNVDLASTLGTLKSILAAEKARLRRSPNLREIYDGMRDPRQMLFYYDPGYARLTAMAGT